jgi:DNA-binding NarL/FixJ family response regulator
MERQAGSQTLRIVTVDDSPIIAQRLRFLITEMPHVDLLGNVEDIQSALVFIEEKKPHVVFLDINLSHDKPRNGIDLLNILRKTYPVLKIIMLTNLSGQRYKEICMSFGADYFFDKSEDFDKIPQALSDIIATGLPDSNTRWWQENQGLWG